MMKRILFILLLVVGFQMSCFASYTLHSSAWNNSEGGSTSIATNTTVTVSTGDLVVVAVGWCTDANTVSSVSDGTSNLTAGTANAGAGGKGTNVQFFWFTSSPHSGSLTYTATYSGSSSCRGISVYSFTPSAGTVTKDQEGGANGNFGTALASGNITTAAGDVIVFGAADNGSPWNYSGEQIGGTTASGTRGAGEVDLWYLATSGTVAVTATISSNQWWAATALSFVNTASGTTCQPSMLTLGVSSCGD
jgi:hypothetical protein